MTTTRTPNTPAPSAASSEPILPLVDRPACAPAIAPALAHLLARLVAIGARPLTLLASVATCIEARAVPAIACGAANRKS
ncbi:hypothetical protein LPB260_15200 [Pseudomonas sp. LPB0260]|uniref:hypothetical protein n=1 Tax=Pseudomonas sp. LPB0260 TaxID=2614442 RepID=UPI0015C1DCF0|nr:hypothetical protein [Pseudomonas sp. LPB0260]QLC72137.1 hypothetical protein LPB260_00250 [Pseudomonas sp. LPB0260]QLC74915.1 hypothetical protein LPB260_15200 [Pseudomonas sp. LPB0260]